jgi:hypothetical protein
VCGKQTLPLLILGKSRMRKRARTDLCGGRSAMVVPTATVDRSQADLSLLIRSVPIRTTSGSADDTSRMLPPLGLMNSEGLIANIVRMVHLHIRNGKEPCG